MKEIFNSLLAGQILNETEAGFALSKILAGEVAAAQTSAFLATIQMRGLHLSELRGFHRVLRENGKPIDLSEFEAIDVCGTGGDGKNTFNISTAAALVLAGANVKTAKHGNLSATSGCGSSDVLAFLGMKFTSDENVLRRQMEDFNFCYLHAPLFQMTLKAVAPLRKEIGFRTFFNLLGTLLNPSRPKFQLIGVAEPGILRLYRYFLEDSGVAFALVHARDGYDEISLTGAFDVVTNDGAETFYPADLGFETLDAEDLRGGETIETASAQLLRILQNEGTTAQNGVVIANAAFAMRIRFAEKSFAECREICAESLRSGAAFRNFKNLINAG